VVEAAERARRSLADAAFYRDSRRLLETSYLRDGTPRGGSGFGGTAEAWQAQRSHLCQAVDRDGSFLDVGCANGHLLESMVAWCAERGIRLEPLGVDLSAGLVAEARRRLPQWADRFWVGNALDWTAPDGRRFDFVHTLLDLVPVARVEQMLRHQLEHLVARAGGCWPAATSRPATAPGMPPRCYDASASGWMGSPALPCTAARGPCRRPGSSTAEHHGPRRASRSLAWLGSRWAFARVVTSASPRAIETAVAMGFAVDDTVELPSG
jgi:SAM-dependent methyltransferase